MIKDTHCDYCGSQLTAGREFVYQYESLKFLEHDSLRKLRELDDETLLASIQNSPDYLGEPLRLCQACHREIEANSQEVRELEKADDRDRRKLQIIFGSGALFAVLWYLIGWVYRMFFIGG